MVKYILMTGLVILGMESSFNFLKNKYKKIVVTCDLDVEDEIKNILIALGFEKGKNYFPIGLNEAGQRNIEGLVPDAIKKKFM